MVESAVKVEQSDFSEGFPASAEARKRRKLQRLQLKTKAPLQAPDVDELLRLLKDAKFVKAKRLGEHTHEYIVLGLSHFGGSHITQATRDHPDLVHLLAEILGKSGEISDVHNGEIWAGHKNFTSIFIGRNNLTPPHIDKNNHGVGFSFCCGRFDSGGELLVRCAEEEAEEHQHAPTNLGDMRQGDQIPLRKISCRGALIAFNGKVIHATAEWSGGDRFVIVYYSKAFTRRTNPSLFAELESLGFQPRAEGWDPDCYIMGHKCGVDEEYMIDETGDRVLIKEEVDDVRAVASTESKKIPSALPETCLASLGEHLQGVRNALGLLKSHCQEAPEMHLKSAPSPSRCIRRPQQSAQQPAQPSSIISLPDSFARHDNDLSLADRLKKRSAEKALREFVNSGSLPACLEAIGDEPSESTKLAAKRAAREAKAAKAEAERRQQQKAEAERRDAQAEAERRAAKAEAERKKKNAMLMKELFNRANEYE